LEYIDQSSKNLKFILTKKDITKKLTIIKESKTRITEKYFIEMAIIGESHFYILKNKEEIELIEIFACVPFDGDLYNKKIEDKETNIKYETKNIKYKSKINIIENDYLNKIENIEDIVLSFEFPMNKSDLFPPKTIISMKKNENKVIIKTLHCYPNEKIIVETKSEINIL